MDKRSETSPITLDTTNFWVDHDYYGISVAVWEHEGGWEFGALYCTERLATTTWGRLGHQYTNLSDEHFTATETRAAWSLIRSQMWRSQNAGASQVLLTMTDERDAIRDKIHTGNQGTLTFPIVWSFADFVRKAKSLTLAEKAHETLRNFYGIFAQERKPQPCPFISPEARQNQPPFLNFEARPNNVERGKTYGCDDVSACFVYEYLYEEGYIKYQNGVLITAKGYDLLDKLSRGDESGVELVFVVRRWDTELDKLIEPACKMAGEVLGVDIDAVWAKEHNGKIDEKVFRDLRRAIAVVVDLTPAPTWDTNDRINVGIETGYAMALGKPVIAIRCQPVKGVDRDWHFNLPFDIVTLSTYDYGREPTGDTISALAEKLTARVGLALDLHRKPLNRL